MDRVFKPDKVIIRDNRSIFWYWFSGGAALLLVLWGIGLGKIWYDHQQLQDQASHTALVRAHDYAEQLHRTLGEIDQISLTLKYQMEHLDIPLDLSDQYQKAMHHTPTYPAVMGADGKFISSWRKQSIGLDMSGQDFFSHHQISYDDNLKINPPSAGMGGLTGKKTIRFTRRINDNQGEFAGVVLVSAEQSYLANLNSYDQFHEGDFISARLIQGTQLVAKMAQDQVSNTEVFSHLAVFPTAEGVVFEPGDSFLDGRPRYLGWKVLTDYPVIAIAGITEDSALVAYASTRNSYLAIGGIISVLIIFACVSGGLTHAENARRRMLAERVRATFRLAVDGAREAFYMLQPLRARDGEILDYRIEDCNERAATMFGIPRKQLIGQTFTEIYSSDERQQMYDFFGQLVSQAFIEDEMQIKQDSIHQPGWFQRQALRSGDGIAVTVRDVTEAKLQQQEIAKLAITDTLTGLPNRRWLNEFLPGALLRARSARKRCALLFIDLDNFKKINDTLGHAAGDELLRMAAICLKNTVRTSDAVIRLGGDEFTVLIEHLDRDDYAELVAAQIVNSFRHSPEFAPWAARDVKCSVGIAIYPTHAHDADGLLHQADAAMYQAKSAGKGCYRVCSTERRDSARLIS